MLNAVFVDAGVGGHLSEESGVGRQFVVDLGAGVVDLRAGDKEVRAEEGAGFVKHRMSLGAAVGDVGVVAGNDHGGVTKETGARRVGVEREDLGDDRARSDGADAVQDAVDIAGAAVEKLLGENGGVAVFGDALHAGRGGGAAVVGVKSRRHESPPKGG